MAGMPDFCASLHSICRGDFQSELTRTLIFFAGRDPGTWSIRDDSDESDDSEDDGQGGVGYTGEDGRGYHGVIGAGEKCQTHACKLSSKAQADDAGEHDMADVPCVVAGCAERGAASRRAVVDAGATAHSAWGGKHDVAGRCEDHNGTLAGGVAAQTGGGRSETGAEGGGASAADDDDERTSVAGDAARGGSQPGGRVADALSEEDALSDPPAQLIEVILERQPLSEVTGERTNAPLFGVGLGLDACAHGGLVQVLAPGGAAARCGMLEVGDLVVTVDDVRISGSEQ